MSMSGLMGTLILLAVIALSGCGRGEQAVPGLEEWFRETRGGLESPYGRIAPESVREEGGAVIFQTEDGSMFRQTYRPNGGGGYERIGDPQFLSEGESP